MTHSIELDFCHELSFGELLDHIEPYELTAQIVKLCGPGGGNPLLSLSGTYLDIVRYLAEDYTDGDSSDLEMFVSHMTKHSKETK